MGRVDLVGWAAVAAAEHLCSLGRRWRHVDRVGLLAKEVGRAFAEDGDTLVAAAYLHDIGYAPALAKTGFHPLDGARFVRAHGYERLACLVAHHSGARYEAELRGIDNFLEEFPYLDSDLDRALTYCDLTTGPDGTRVHLEQRVAEITNRYGADHVVARAINAGVPEFERAREETELRMAREGVRVSGSLALSH